MRLLDQVIGLNCKPQFGVEFLMENGHSDLPFHKTPVEVNAQHGVFCAEGLVQVVDKLV